MYHFKLYLEVDLGQAADNDPNVQDGTILSSFVLLPVEHYNALMSKVDVIGENVLNILNLLNPAQQHVPVVPIVPAVHSDNSTVDIIRSKLPLQSIAKLTAFEKLLENDI